MINEAKVTHTKEPYTLRVSFLTLDEPCKQTEAVCYLHANKDTSRVDIYYSHEVFRIRPLESAPWEADNPVRVPLGHTLRAQILVGVQRAICGYLMGGEVHTMTVPPDVDPTALGRFIP